MSGTTVRIANLNDARAIGRLGQHLGYEAIPRTLVCENLKTILELDHVRLWMAEKDVQPVGWLHAFIIRRPVSRPFVEIGAMVVSPASRRQGAGRLLVNEAKAWALEQGLSLRVRCNTEREESNLFYEALGFDLSKRQNILDFPS